MRSSSGKDWVAGARLKTSRFQSEKASSLRPASVRVFQRWLKGVGLLRPCFQFIEHHPISWHLVLFLGPIIECMSLKNGFENFPSVKNIHDLPSVGDSNKRILVSSIAKLAIWNGSSYNYINPFTEQDGCSHIGALGGTMIGVVT